MKLVAQFGLRVFLRRPLCCYRLVYRAFCSDRFCSDNDDNGGDRRTNGLDHIKKLIVEGWKVSGFDSSFDAYMNEVDDDEKEIHSGFSLKRRFFECTRRDSDKVFDVLRQDGPGFSERTALDGLDMRISGLLVRQVLLKILLRIDYESKSLCARLAYKFFIWSSEQEYYRHTVNTYHLLMKIFAASDEFDAMCRLLDEMMEKGYPVTARTFNILIGYCHEVGLQKTVVEKFIRSKTFQYRPFKHSYNAILLCLLKAKQYTLIEWLYQKMLSDSYSPDVLTYNILVFTKYRLGKSDQVHKLIDEMGKEGFSPDIHTYSVLLHIIGKGDRPLAALRLLNHMREVGVYPSSLHFTTLIDGLSRCGDMDACKYFFDEMIKNGVKPDVVCYTVLINGYIAAGELEKALQVFDDMSLDGQLPNAFTYDTIIRGLCMAEKFEEACSMLKKMENKGCNPNFHVYSTLISSLRRVGKFFEAHEIMKDMIEKGQYVHLISRFKRHRK